MTATTVDFDRIVDDLAIEHRAKDAQLVRKVTGWYCPGGPIYRRLARQTIRAG
jgi:hypothetical protein